MIACVAPTVELDHLVVACRTLDVGRAWCEATLGVAPEPGGRHPLMGTHNLLLGLASARFPKAYLELIAIDPDAAAPARRRWFDLDDASLQAALAEPRLVHWVARSDDVEASAAAWRSAGLDDPGRVVAAERLTSSGLLRWRITIRDDGRRPAGGAVPLLIEWSDRHPSDSLPASGVELRSVTLCGVAAPIARGVDVSAAGERRAPLVAVLLGARGAVVLAVPRASPGGSGADALPSA